MGSSLRVARAIFYVGAVGVVIALTVLGAKHEVGAQRSDTDVPAAGTVQATEVPARHRDAQAPAPAAGADKPLLVRDPAGLQQAKRNAADRAAAPQRGLSPVTSPTTRPYGVYNGTNFAGMSTTGSTPSDSTGAIGPTHYVEMVNSAIGVRPRGGTTMTTMGLATFGAANASDCVFDPQISWDQQGGRWLYSFDGQVPTTPPACNNISSNYLAYGFSKSSDPSDLVNGWCRYVLTTPAFFDYDKLGHDNNFIIIGANAFNSSGGVLTSVIVAIPKPGPGVLTSCPVAATATLFGSPSVPLRNADGTLAFTPVPAATADSSSVGYIVAAHDPDTGSANKVMVWHLSSNAGAPVLTPDGDVTVGAYRVPPPIPQPSTGTTASCSTTGNCLDSLDARLTQAVAHFDPDAGVETIWTQHAVTDQAVGTRSVERWYELIAGQSSPRQSGNVSDTSLHIFNGAISPSSAGNEAIMFYNAGNGSAGGFASMRAQSRNSATPLGTMSNETILASSTVSDNDKSCGVNHVPANLAMPCRWGDYSGARPDPTDANAVWGTIMLTGTGGTSTTSGWATQVAAYTPGCVTATISPKTASGLTGSTNQFTATSTGCSNPQYQFLTQTPAGTGPWVINQAFSPSAVWNWDTLGHAAGNYAYAVWANQTGDSTASWEAFDSGTFTLTQAPTCASASLTPPNSSAPVGTTISFSAAAGGCPNPVFQYFLQDPGGTSSVRRGFGTDPTWAWNTAGLVPGTYKVTVWANQRGDQTATAEATATTTLTITGCTVSLSSSPSGTATVGTQVTLTATSTGCNNPRYQFWAQWQGTATKQLLQAYSPSATYLWNSTGAQPGTETFEVWAKDAVSGAGSFDSTTSIPYSVTLPPPCSSVTASAAPTSPQPSGTQVTFTATASACNSPRYQFWMRAASQPDWQLLQSYSSSNTYNWNSTGAAAGAVYFGVWAKDAGSSTSGFEANFSFAYTVTTPACASVTASAAPTTVVHGSGTHVAITAVASGCTNTGPLYEFWLRTPNTDWQLVQPYSTAASYDWNSAGAPVTTVYIGVWAKDAKSSTSGFDANASVAIPVS